MFEKFNRWLSGAFVCRKCKEKMNIMSFGFGETICPHCYDGEEHFIFLDKSYWLNRLLAWFIPDYDLTKTELRRQWGLEGGVVEDYVFSGLSMETVRRLGEGVPTSCPELETCSFSVTPEYFARFCRGKKHRYMGCFRYASKYNLSKPPMHHLQQLAISIEAEAEEGAIVYPT